MTTEPTKRIRCSDDDCGGFNCKHIKFQIEHALAQQRGEYEKRIQQLTEALELSKNHIGNIDRRGRTITEQRVFEIAKEALSQYRKEETK